MPNRTAKFVSALIASLFAGLPVTASLIATPAPAADECLSAPKGETPEGSHWYYRIEHPSNHHCWYLREEGEAHTQAAPSRSSVTARPVSPKPDTAMPGSVANARAELPSPRASLDQEASTGAAQLPAAADAANAGDTDNTSRSGLPAANMLNSVVASRWPEQLGASSPAAPPPAPAGPPADLQVDATTATPPVAAAVPLAAADASLAKQSHSALMLLIVIVGALSFAGLVASAIVRFGGKRRHDRREIRGDRRPIWDLERGDRPRPLPFPAEAARRPNIGAPRELRVADDADDQDRIAQMLARLARSAQS